MAERSKTVEIPRDRIQKGVELSIANSEQYIKDCKVLLQGESLPHAVVMAVFSCEEFAKAAFLLACFEEQRKENMIRLDKRIFNSHEFKIQYARKEGLTLIMGSPRLGYGRLALRLGGKDVVASPGLKLDCAFVGYRDEKWILGTDCETSSTPQFLYEIQEKLKHLRSRFMPLFAKNA